MTPQDAIFHGPGAFSALVTWDVQRTPEPSVREALATLHRRVREEGRLHLLIGVRSELWVGMDSGVLPRDVPDVRGFPKTQGDVLFQLAAPGREALLWGLQQLHAVLRGMGRCAEEIIGGRIGPGREPFGFRDGLETPTRERIEEEAVIPTAPLTGSCWVLYLRFQQDLEHFARLRPARQLEVMGRGREGEEVRGAPEDAHVRRMREAGYGSNRGMIRRGFPFRQSQEEGLAFVALAREPQRFSRALDAMLGRGFGGRPESLLRYVQPVSGGLYAAPPDEWFTSL